MFYSQKIIELSVDVLWQEFANANPISLASISICQGRYYDVYMARIKIHLRVFLYALIFGMIAYGVVQIGIALHRFFAF